MGSNVAPSLRVVAAVQPAEQQPDAEQLGLIDGLDLPQEVSLADAAMIANCDKKTIIRYMQDGVLEWRNIAPPSSSRPTYRLKLASVVALRTAYRRENPVSNHHVDDPASRITPLPKPAPSHQQFKHIRLRRG